MSVINRIILFFYALAFGAVSLLTLVLFARFIPDAQIWNEFLYLCSRWETVLVATVIFICSLYLVIQSLSTHSKDVSANEAAIIQGKMGDVRISLAALKNMADKIARSIQGVRDVKVKLKMTKAQTKDKTLLPNFKLRLIVGEDHNIVAISDELKIMLNAYLEKYIGIEQAIINIEVESISNNSTANNKKRVV